MFLHHTATVIAQAECEEQSLCRDCIALPECTWCSDNTVRTGPKLLVCLSLLHTPFRHAVHVVCRGKFACQFY